MITSQISRVCRSCGLECPRGETQHVDRQPSQNCTVKPTATRAGRLRLEAAELVVDLAPKAAVGGRRPRDTQRNLEKAPPPYPFPYAPPTVPTSARPRVSLKTRGRRCSKEKRRAQAARRSVVNQAALGVCAPDQSTGQSCRRSRPPAAPARSYERVRRACC
jgi:hypothetical protein